MAERTVTCADCGSKFTARRKDAKFCSRMCHWRFQREPIPERKCLWCNGPMDSQRRGAQYCCLQHKKNAAGERFRGRNPGYYSRYHHGERMLAWKEANRERNRVLAREKRRDETPEENATRKAKANPGSVGVSQRDWVRLCRRFANCCAYCGIKPDKSIEMDHVIPLTKGGRHAIGNVLPACHDCNLSKNARYLSDWRYREGKYRARTRAATAA